ncbi:MAG: excinuclease ABC subunit UvrB [Mycoplasmataceae bacterium]|nr:excinuclease ABC subunit UvrB [Mycoplasmataceae bacterium]
MNRFSLNNDKLPKGDQPKAIKESVESINLGNKGHILLGATGTGKTFTVANIIEQTNKQTLIIAPNKTLAGQLYAELKELFPNNRVEYFISNFDYYRPEAYVVSSDTYLEKTSKINWDIEMMRINAVSSLLTRDDTIVVSSVASIFSLRDPKVYENAFFEIEAGDKIKRKDLLYKLSSVGFKRNNIEIERGNMRVNGDIVDIFTAEDKAKFIRVSFFDDEIEFIKELNADTNKVLRTLERYTIFPVDSNITDSEIIKEAIPKIKEELKETVKKFEDEGKILEAQRLENRTKLDIEQLQEYGFCSGIENYSMYLDGRKKGETPFCIMDYFNDDFLLVVDESHITIPQISGMYKGDRSRKENLVKYGFRLPTALDNRPLNFDEFVEKTNQTLYVSATPGDYELEKKYSISRLINRPTGLVDPLVTVVDNIDRIDKVYNEIQKQIENGERTLITTLTIKMSIELSKFLKTKGVKVAYINSELKTLERDEVIRRLRIGIYDVVVGINLLREGLDIPEVSLVMILDADKSGFLRNYRSLVQTIGRASRNNKGRVIMFADEVTKSMKDAMDETSNRREIQIEYNKKNNITPVTIVKEIPPKIIELNLDLDPKKKKTISKMSQSELKEKIRELTITMKKASEELDFENAMKYRDAIIELKSRLK